MGMPERGEIPELLNECEFYMETKDNIGMFRYLATIVVKMYEKEMRKKGSLRVQRLKAGPIPVNQA